jgi:acyl phosphate:glycerol-3-phosphate acyltransferase
MHFLQPAIAGILAGVACILGHNFPVWLKFKGGKGVATSLGVVFGLVPLAGAVAFAVWAVVFFATRYVSLASIIGSIAVPVTVAFTAWADEKKPLLIFTSLAVLLIVARHRENIKRLLNGTENRFTKSKSSKP